LSGCEAPQNTVTAPQGTPPTKNESQTTPPKTQQDPITAQQSIRLTAEDFLGTVLITTDSIVQTEEGFEIPVYLENVNAQDMIDTVSIKSMLPTGVELQEVQTPSGYTAQLDVSDKNAPVVYYYPHSLSPSSYKPVVASDEPLFTLSYSGTFQGPITFEGSFFRTDGILIRTTRGQLAP
jgi:hypothetical protein